MSATTFLTCCCQPGGLYYALKCPEFFSNYCCPVYCGQAPARINLCPDYLASIGIPVPPTPGVCYVIAYDCCAYVLTGFEDVPCCPAVSPYPCNVGFLIATYPSNNEPCCRPYATPKLPPGEMGEIPCPECPGGYLIVNNNDPCHEYIADCYDKCDQYGLVATKPLEVCSTLSVCVSIPGVPPGQPCNHGPPDTVYKITRKVTQKIGSCITSCPTYNGVPLEPCTPNPFGCPNERVQLWFEYAECGVYCPWVVNFDCCGGPDPCESDPTICDTLLDPRYTYEIKTCYSVTDCGEDIHEEEVMLLRVWDCLPYGAGVNPNNPVALYNWVVEQFINISSVQTTVCSWGQVGTLRFEICNLIIDIVSGTAVSLKDKINGRIGALVQAFDINPWSSHFWFGTRQPCIPCGEEDICLNRPAYLPGDELAIGTITYLPAQSIVEIKILGRSVRKRACVSQSMNSEFNCRGYDPTTATVSAALSARGPYPYELHCLSMPEFSYGLRYEWMQVEEPASTIELCTGPNQTTILPDCDETQGYPLEDIVVVIGGIPTIVAQGYRDLCGSMPDPRRNCRCYFPSYEICGCDVGPCPTICNGIYYDPNQYCITTGSGTPLVSYCGTNCG